MFGPVFQRFSKWSINTNVPSLGDSNTPFSDVNNFYEFWFQFKSWRDFSYLDEFDLNEAESRDEKRWMERQNDREKKKRKQEEFSKIFKLTELAEKLDPRIKAQKEQEKMAKQQKKQQKLDEKRKKQEEIQQQQLAEKQRKEEIEKKQQEEANMKKKARDAELKLLKRLRQDFLNSVEPIKATSADVEILCAKLTINDMQDIITVFKQNDLELSKKTFYEKLQQIQDEEKQKQKEKEEQERIKKQEGMTGKAWTDDELSLLAQAIAKFPGGTTERWQKVADFIGTRSVKEIIARTKESSVSTFHFYLIYLLFFHLI